MFTFSLVQVALKVIFGEISLKSSSDNYYVIHECEVEMIKIMITIKRDERMMII